MFSPGAPSPVRAPARPAPRCSRAGRFYPAPSGASRLPGTLTLAAGGRWAYDASPTDRLVVEAGSLVQKFVVLEAQGNQAAADADAWIASNHVLRYRHRVTDVLDVEVTDRSVNGRFSFSLKGRAYYAKKPFDADLKAEGTYSFQRDLAGYDARSSYALKGTLTGEGVRADVDETHEFRLISAQEPSRRPGIARTSGGGRVVSYSDDTIRNRLRLGDDTYVWKARFVKDFVNGKVPLTQPTAWRCGGTITRNGKAWGKYEMGSTARLIHGKWMGNVRVFMLITPEGKTILRHFP